MCFKIHCLIVNNSDGLWPVIIKHLHVSHSLIWCFSAAGLLLWTGCLLAMLRLLSQDQTVHLDTIHVRPLLHAGHGDLCHHDVPHCGDCNARTCESLFRASQFAFFSYQVPSYIKTIKSGLRSAAVGGNSYKQVILVWHASFIFSVLFEG